MAQPPRFNGLLDLANMERRSDAGPLAAAGNVVLDLLPTGLPSGADPNSYEGDWVTNVRAMLIGRSLPGMRAHDILEAVQNLNDRTDVDSSRICGSASGTAAFWLLLAAAADSKLSGIQLDGTPYSFQPALDAPVHYSLHDAAIDGFFLNFDIPDLVSALGRRTTTWTHPTDWLRNVVSTAVTSPNFSAVVTGQNLTKSHFQLQIEVTNAGPGTAIGLVATNLAFQTLTGTGNVTAASHLPVLLGDLAPGSSAKLTISLQVPQTV